MGRGQARKILLDLLQEMNGKRLLVHEVAADGQKFDRTDATNERISKAIKELVSFTLPTPKK
jgi:hypothetical protein